MITTYECVYSVTVSGNMDSVELNAREQFARIKLSKTDSKRAKKKRDSSSSRSATTGVSDNAVEVQQLPAVPVSHQQLSDSSDSNNGNSAKRPFVNTAECTVTHEGTQAFNVILPVNIDTLFQTLYSNSKFLEEFHEARKIFDITRTEWTDVKVGANNGAIRTRTFNCKMPIKQNIGPKFSIVSICNKSYNNSHQVRERRSFSPLEKLRLRRRGSVSKGKTYGPSKK